LRGGKRDLYEGGIRVPLIAYWPGRIKRGTVTDHVSAFWDVLPTFCEVAGMTPPNNINGISFYPTLMGAGIQDHHPFLYWEFYERSGAKAIRAGSWKAVQRNLYEHPDSPTELYNLDEDVGENKNVADDYPGIVIQMDSIMSTAHIPSAVFTFQR
jgi:arylsulfatase A-like enzyme